MTGPDAFYTPSQRALQRSQGREALADTVFAGIVSDQIDEAAQGFIESRDYFFLSTVDGPTTLSFPCYDGNGMFKSMGNLAETAKVGLLFMDFEVPNRIRVQGSATLTDDAALLARWPGAKLAVQVAVESCFLNCARYIHKHKRIEASPYVPDAKGQQPHPAWKRIDAIQPALTDAERARTEAEGGTIDQDGYVERLMAGTS